MLVCAGLGEQLAHEDQDVVRRDAGDEEEGDKVDEVRVADAEDLRCLERLLRDLVLVAVLGHEPHRQLWVLLEADVLVEATARREGKERLLHGVIVPLGVLAMDVVLDGLDDRPDAAELCGDPAFSST